MSGVVLIAAPENGLESLTKLFSGLPSGLEAAFVVAVPGHGGAIDRLKEIIGHSCGLKTKLVKQKDRLEPDTVHILPGDRISTLKKSRFAIAPERGVHKGLVDSFLLSLAGDQGEKAIGIILSGLKRDGRLGLMAIKKAGGLAVVERTGRDASNAAYPTGMVDCLLPGDEIVGRLVNHLAHRGVDKEATDKFKPGREKMRRMAKVNGNAGSGGMRHEHVQEIESELRLAKERLRATIEELESTKDAHIHARKTAEERQRLLLVELQHRVKNILAVVRSLAHRTAERAENLEDFTAHFDGRLSAMGRTQNILARTAEGSVDLVELVHDELVGHAAHYGDQVDVNGPGIKLRAKSAQTLSLAIHELATNAVKYGALSAPSGHIVVSWRIQDEAGNPRLAFEWLESGVPVIDQQPLHSGFGRELIERGLPYELNANTALEFRQGGIRCIIQLPLDDKVIVR